MKVLMLVSHPQFGGTETHILLLAKALRAYGIRTGVATYGGPYVPVLKRHGIPVHKLPYSGRRGPGAASSVQSLVKKYGYRAVHVHDTESFRLLAHLRRHKPKYSLIMTVHGMYYSREKLNSSAKHADRVIAVSRRVQQRLIQAGIQPKKVQWVPNGIDTRTFFPNADRKRYRRLLGLPLNPTILLYVGRFQSDKWKIARQAILACERVAKKKRDFVTVLVGYGSYRKQLSKLAKQVNGRLGRKAILVLPATKHIEQYYRASDLVVGTGRVALEAMASGKPVMAAGAAGYEGVVRPRGISQTIFNQFGDHGSSKPITIPALERDIVQLLKQPKLMSDLGKYGRKIVDQRFSASRASNLMRKLYHGLLK
jgi:glycosyltransferase involved in cell wall biosynthesis